MITAYFIQAHRDPHQICRLIRAIKAGSPHALVIIGYDFTNSSFDDSLLKEFSTVYLLKEVLPVHRGDFSAIRPYLNAVDWLLSNGYAFDWLVYISGQCYPVQSVSKLESYLASTKYDGLIEYFDILSDASKWDSGEGYGRYFYQKVSNLPDWSMFPSRMLNKLGILKPFPYLLKSRETFAVSLWKKAKHHPFTENFICYGGNHRHILSRGCVEYLNDFINGNSDIVNYFSQTWCPEESIVQTILINSQKFMLLNENKIFDDYSYTRDGSPRVVTDSDYDLLTGGKYFFARKVDPSKSSRLLDMIDASLS
jgi:hypothetical protein